MHRESSPAKGQDVRRVRGKPESGRAVVEGRGGKTTGRLLGKGGEAAKGQVVR